MTRINLLHVSALGYQSQRVFRVKEIQVQHRRYASPLLNRLYEDGSLVPKHLGD